MKDRMQHFGKQGRGIMNNKNSSNISENSGDEMPHASDRMK
jgi:hypothetical protein